MLKKLSYFFLFISVCITVSHNVIAHHHELESLHYGHSHHHNEHDGDDDHNVFSFAQLDETFIHSNDQIQFDCSSLSIVKNEFIFDFKLFSQDQPLIIDRVFPPPNDLYRYISSLRGPPAC